MSTNEKLIIGALLLLWWFSRKKESAEVKFNFTEPGFEGFSGQP